MITYEVNIICDKCRNQCVTGEPMDRIEEAIESARSEAIANKWDDREGRFLCDNCKPMGKD